MKLLIEGEKIISAGFSDYVAKENQTVETIDNSKWLGYRKIDIKWDNVNKEIIVLTDLEKQNIIDKADALKELQRLHNELLYPHEDIYEALKLKGHLVDADMPEKFIDNMAERKVQRVKYNK